MRSTGYKIVNTGRNEGLRFKKPVGTPEDRKARDLSPPAVYTFKTFYFFLSLSLLSFLFFFFASCLDNFSSYFSTQILQSFLEISLYHKYFQIWIVNSHQDIFTLEEPERTWETRAEEQSMDFQFGKWHLKFTLATLVLGCYLKKMT